MNSILPNEDVDYVIKIILVGESGVGKTNLLSQFARGLFVSNSKTTIGVEFASKTIEYRGKKVKVQIWDTAGQERYRAITNSYYRGTKGAMILYDITSAATFNALPKWLAEVRESVGNDVPIMLIGNKLDLEDKRSILQKEAAHYAEIEKMLYFETSAMDSTNVETAFNQMINEICQLNFVFAGDNLVQKGISIKTEEENGKCC
ncbi:ras-related protein RABA2a [Histomonas meleagridis]|uniref:ras-related protein RABA2a n=1 Tax=Histomonas meleagridis TaxID=135588 RepID=UPI00355AA81E|nr:ras-related protein RABA2a [Histomonas meleagridis]KAH0805953.1 ras-related protein RABA2a [Histomonas meleagridis]